MEAPLEANRVVLKGKINRVGGLRYTPVGTAIREFTLAVPQQMMGEKNFGYFEMMMVGETAEENSLRIGREVKVSGQLWGRDYKNRRGERVKEFRVIVDSIEGEK